jgi:hypothetical protein
MAERTNPSSSARLMFVLTLDSVRVLRHGSLMQIQTLTLWSWWAQSFLRDSSQRRKIFLYRRVPDFIADPVIGVAQKVAQSAVRLPVDAGKPFRTLRLKPYGCFGQDLDFALMD